MAVGQVAARAERARPAWIERVVRPVLWVGVGFNAVVAGMLLFPWRLGGLDALPEVNPVYYRWMLAYFVALFSATYGWLALQREISRPVVALAALGKTGVFVVSLVCLLRGDIPARTLAVACVDLVFALYFFAWLRTTRDPA